MHAGLGSSETLNAEGEAALRDKRKNNTGVRFLDETQEAALAAFLRMAVRVRKWLRGFRDTPASCDVGWISQTVTLQTPRPSGSRNTRRSKHLKKNWTGSYA